MNLDCLKTFYYSQVYSKLQYALLTWGSASQTKPKQLDTLKIIGTMVIHGPLKDPMLSNSTICKSCDLLKLENIYKLEMAKLMHRFVNKALPPKIQNLFTEIQTMHRYHTRSSRVSTCLGPKVGALQAGLRLRELIFGSLLTKI